MSSIPNVFDFVTTSNRVRQTYFVGFVDINGGNLILRPNSNLFITGGDTSMNGSLSVSGNTSIGSNLSINGNITLSNRLIGGSDVSLNKNLFLGGDASFNGDLFVNRDVSLNGDLVTNGNIYVGQLNDAAVTTLSTYSYDISNTATFSSPKEYKSYTTGLLANVPGIEKTIKVSANGQFMIISDFHNQRLAVSKDYGRNWNTVISNIPFYHCAISATGQYMIACANPGLVYISNNFGSSFTTPSVSNLSSLSTQTWSSVAISGNGQYMTAVMNSTAYSGFAYVSRDFGQSWSNVSLNVSTLACGRCAMSSDGKYQIISNATTGSSINTCYLSSNYGQSFATSSNIASVAPTTKWWDVTVSSSGKYMLISAHSTNTGCYYSKDYGATWSPVGGGIILSYNYNSVAMSANGQYMMFASSTGGASALYVQNNSPGTTGQTVSTYMVSSDGISNANFASCAISADGKYFVAISSSTITANVYIVEPVKSALVLVNTYSYRTTPPSLLNLQGSTNPITLLDNSVLFSNQPPILLSQFGQSWRQLDGFSMMSSATICTSNIGQYILIESGTNGTGQLSLSNNYGSTFSYFSPSNLYQNWSDYVCSANGQYQTAVIDGGFVITTPYAGIFPDNSFNSGNVYISNDFGATFRPSVVRANTPMAWTAMSLSANGQYQTGTVNGSVLNNGGIYVSSNYGVTWTQIVPVGTNTSTTWVEISMSATGQFQTAVISGGFLYRSTDFGITWNPVTSIGSKSWSFVSVSSTGQYQTALVNGENIYTSTNYGASWSANTSAGAKSWISCSMTANAQYQMAVEGLVLVNGIPSTGGQVWYSNNYGVTWNSSGLTPAPYIGVTTNGNGQFSYLVSSAGAFFVNALGSPSTVPEVSASQTVNGDLNVGSSSTFGGTSTFNGPVTINTSTTLNILPAGMIMAWVSSTAPTGWLICNGAIVSRTTYGALFAVIGTTFGVGDGSTTFKIPDYKGAFLRGTGTNEVSGYTNYTGSAINTAQSHATQTHKHDITDSGHAHMQYVSANANSGGTGIRQDWDFDANGLTPYAQNINTGTATTNIVIKDSTTSVDPNETRPFNYAINWVIKY